MALKVSSSAFHLSPHLCVKCRPERFGNLGIIDLVIHETKTLPRPLAGFKGPTSKGNGRGERRREGEKEREKEMGGEGKKTERGTCLLLNLCLVTPLDVSERSGFQIKCRLSIFLFFLIFVDLFFNYCCPHCISEYR